MDDDSTIITEAEPGELDREPSSLNELNFLEWGPVEIEQWLHKLEFGHEMISKFTLNNIVGESLPYLTDEHFEEMEISLKDKVKLKIEISKILVDNEFIRENNNELKLILKNINTIIQSNINDLAKSLNQEILRLKEEATRTRPLPTPEKTTSPFNLSPTKQNQSPVTTEITRKESKLSKSNRNSILQPSPSQLTTPTSPIKKRNSIQSQTIQQPVSEPLKQLRASTDDPCSKILQAAMKRHKLHEVDWRNYALVICYGDKERILELDEKPVMIFKELRERGEHPAIMLRQKADYDQSVASFKSQTPGGKL